MRSSPLMFAPAQKRARFGVPAHAVPIFLASHPSGPSIPPVLEHNLILQNRLFSRDYFPILISRSFSWLPWPPL